MDVLADTRPIWTVPSTLDPCFLDIAAVNRELVESSDSTVSGTPVSCEVPLSVLNVVVSSDMGTDRLDETNLADSFSLMVSVP